MSQRLLSMVVPIMALAACSTTAPPAAPAQPAIDAVAMVTAIRAAGAADARELVVRPLGDTRVTDLQEQAVALQAEGRHADAAEALDQALAITPDDPGLLQERAEAAVLTHDLAAAERFARQAIAAGTDVGPKCRQHWETIVQVVAATAPQPAPATAGAGAAPAADSPLAQHAPASHAPANPALSEARAQRDACTVGALPRY